MAQDYFGFRKPANKIVVAATDSCFFSEYKLETATNAYAGRLAMMGTNEDDIKVADAATYMPHGFIGYEQSFLGSTSMTSNRPATVDTIYAASARVPVLKGGGFWIVGAVPAGFAVKKGDMLAPWTGGLLVPVVPMMGGYAIRVPFVKKTAEYDTGIDLPVGTIVSMALARVVTNEASGTLDVGILSTESGDADGFIDGLSCATAGVIAPIMSDASADADNTLGELISNKVTGDVASAYLRVPKPHVIETGKTSLTYTTSNHTVAGDFFVVMNGFGFAPVAIAEQNIATTTAVTDVMVRSLI